MRVGLYARVSTIDKQQDPEMQLRELRLYAKEREWAINEYVDRCSGVKEKRPEFMRLMADAKSGNIDVVLTWKIDRFSRSLKHLLNTLDELQDIGVAFVSLKENLDLTTSVGKLMSHVIGAFAQFEKDLVRERVIAGLANAKAKGKKLGRRAKKPISVAEIIEAHNEGLSDREIALKMALPVSSVYSTIKRHKALQLG